MADIYTLKVYPKGQGRNIYRVLEVDGYETLDDLCDEILEVFSFEPSIFEHLYEFCMNNKIYSDDCYLADSDEPGKSTNIEINQLNLTKGQNFTFHYDFGDDWVFIVHVQKIELNSSKEIEGFYELVREKGSFDPYPDDDDEFEEYE